MNVVTSAKWKGFEMHVPKEFEMLDPVVIEKFINEHGFATLVSIDDPFLMRPASVHRMMHGLVGFEISIEKIEAISKLSQGRDHVDRVNIITELKKLGSLQAKLMARRMEEITHITPPTPS